MERFLILYRAPVAHVEEIMGATPEEQQAEMDAWMAWGAAVGDALADWGSPTEPVAFGEGAPGDFIGGYSILQAESADAVATLLADHPHRRVGTIEVLRCLPMPGS